MPKFFTVDLFAGCGCIGQGGGTLVRKSFLHPAMPGARGRLCGDRFSASGLGGGGCAGMECETWYLNLFWVQSHYK